MSKYLSTPNKTWTCVYSLGESCSIHWTMRVYTAYLHRPAVLNPIWFVTKNYTHYCIVLIYTNTIAAIYHRTIVGIVITKEISCIAGCLLPYHREIQYHSCTRIYTSCKKVPHWEIPSCLWILQLLFSWFFSYYFVKPSVQRQYFKLFLWN